MSTEAIVYTILGASAVLALVAWLLDRRQARRDLPTVGRGDRP